MPDQNIGHAMINPPWKETPGATTWKCSLKNGVLKNFAKFTGKHLCRNLFFNKVAGVRPAKKETVAKYSLKYFSKHNSAIWIPLNDQGTNTFFRYFFLVY